MGTSLIVLYLESPRKGTAHTIRSIISKDLGFLFQNYWGAPKYFMGEDRNIHVHIYLLFQKGQIPQL